MFFDSVTLSKKSWHYRLQKITFGQVYFTKNFCPYFWLTIASIVILPFTAVRWTFIGLAFAGFFLFGLLYTVVEAVVDLFTKYICTPYISKAVSEYVNEMSDEDAYLMAVDLFGEACFYHKSGTDGSLRDRVKQNWYNYTGDYGSKEFSRRELWWKEWMHRAGDKWEEILRKAQQEYKDKAQERYLLQQKYEAAQEAAEKRRKAFFLGLVKYTKYLVWLAVGIAAIYLTYWLALLGVVIYENWSSVVWFFGEIGSGLKWMFTKGLLWLAILSIPTALLVGLIFFCVKMIQRCTFIKAPKTLKKVGNGVWSVIDFFVMFIKTFKEDNCPAIEWKNE